MINKLKKLAYFLNEIVKPEQNTQEQNKDESASETYKTATTHRNLIIVFAILLATMTSSCSKPKLTQEPESLQEPSVEATFPTICLYTLGDVRLELRKAIMDSLQRHYPKCRFERNIPLPQCAITKKRHDHTRYISDSLNVYLAKFQTDSTIVIGLTSADIGKDNFRGRLHIPEHIRSHVVTRGAQRVFSGAYPFTFSGARRTAHFFRSISVHF